MIKAWKKILVICCCFYQVSVNAETVDIELKYYNKASYYLGQGKFKLAASQWHQLSLIFLRSEAKLGNRKMWQYAGFAEALAAISANKANDVIAYQYWADSTRFLMTGGTNWPLIQKQLHQRFETANTQLSAFMQVNDLSINDSNKWQQDLALLQVLNDRLAVFTFTSPKLGLSGKREAVVITNQPPAVNYKGAFQPNKKLSGLGASTFRGNQITPSSDQLQEHEQVQPQPKPQVSELAILDSVSISSAVNTVIAPSDVKKKVVQKVVYSDISQPVALPKSEKITTETATQRVVGSSLSQPIETRIIQPVEHIPLVEIAEIDPKIKSVTTAEAKIELNIKPVAKVEPKPAPKLTTVTQPTVPNPMSRGNMATIEDENVEALQRRSFAPVTIN